MNQFKKIIGKLHLWLGLISGLIVFIVSITGCIYVFKDEIQNFQRKDYIYHGETNIEQKNTLPISQLESKITKQVHEKYQLHWVDIPLDKSTSYQFHYYESNPDGWNYFQQLVIYKTVYVNSFTGKVLAVIDEKNSFFNIVKFIHWSLLLKKEWGTYLIGIPTLIFVFMLISGIILWWPRNKNGVKQRFTFQWSNVKNWKRKNYDLHNILGFYASIIAFVISFTGLFYAFTIIKAFVYFTFSSGETTYPDFSHIKTKAPIEQKSPFTIDKIAAKVEQVYPLVHSYSFDLGHPHLDDHKHPNFSIYVKELSYAYYKSHSIIFDENSGELLHIHAHNDKNWGEKMTSANYDIHVGAIGGFVGKCIAFFASLIAASLPVTGFMIWWGRKRKKVLV
jgi:uncharacterized iron-regulated membrane protein